MKKGVFAVVVGVITTLSLVRPVHAAESGSGLGVSPTQHNLELEPSKEETVTYNINNVTSGDVTIKTFINDIESDNTSGDPILITDETKRTSESIRDFIGDLADFDIPAKQSKSVEVKIKVPSNAASGSYYGAIRFQSLPKQAEGDASGDDRRVSLTASVSSLIFVTVPGSIKNSMQIIKTEVFRTVQNIDRSGRFFANAPNKVGFEVKNTGNGVLRPFGTITIKRSGGKSETFEFNTSSTQTRSAVLPGTNRVFKEDISKYVTKPGKYTISLPMAYENGGPLQNAKVTFWYFPKYYLVLPFVLIAVLATVVVLSKKKKSNSKSKAKA